MRLSFRRICLLSFVLAALTASLAPARADLRLASIFGDHMVLQFGRVIPVWGWSEPGREVKVSFRHFMEKTTSAADGRWRVEIGPLDAGGPDKLVVASGEQVIVLDDVLAGEVWLCSGQSNMEMTVNRCLNAEAEIASADFPEIRQFKIPHTNAREPLDDIRETGGQGENSYQRSWQPASPETVGRFSAAGYFFARNLHLNLGEVPVGLINSSWGGSVAEAWVSAEGMNSSAEIARILTEWPENSRHSEGWRRGYKTYLANAEKALVEGRDYPPYYREPSVLYNGMIAPLAGLGIRGVIWYQGEANVTRPAQYARLFQTLITDWRNRWGRDLPFIWVQLPGFQAGLETWPLLREAQAAALELPNTAMAVAIDLGERHDIHPRNKQAVGNRLAIAARGLVYLEDLPSKAPAYESMTVAGARCRVEFNNSGDGLASSDGEPVRGFSVAGDDRVFVAAKAVIENGAVVVWSDQVTGPVAVRYAWTNFPADLNLYGTYHGSAWLPAAPFRTDDWETMPELELFD
ncbi:MAG: sialate O-acetylesterase [Candidatus Glassbacteria bacterium]|nr:sialate O-acetylesterase [Candidatus Glassbacteria bacterium]